MLYNIENAFINLNFTEGARIKPSGPSPLISGICSSYYNENNTNYRMKINDFPVPV